MHLKKIADFHLKSQGNIAKKLKNIGNHILNIYFLRLVICHDVYLVLLVVASLFKQMIYV